MEVLFQHPISCYIFAMAFQLTGAILLLVYFCGHTKDRIYREYFPGSNIIERDNNNKVTLEMSKIRDCVRNIYLNRMAFIYITMGYVLGVYGEVKSLNKNTAMLVIVCTTIIFIVISYVVSTAISKILYRENWLMDYDEISDIADTTMTIEEIDEICKW